MSYGPPGSIILDPPNPIPGQVFTAYWSGANKKGPSATIGIYGPYEAGQPLPVVTQPMNTGDARQAAFTMTMPANLLGSYVVQVFDQDGPGATSLFDASGAINPVYAAHGGYLYFTGTPAPNPNPQGNGGGGPTQKGATLDATLQNALNNPTVLIGGAALLFLVLMRR